MQRRLQRLGVPSATPASSCSGSPAHPGRPGERGRPWAAPFPPPDAGGLDAAAFFAPLHRLLTLEWNYRAPAAEREQFGGVLTRLARTWEARAPGRSADEGFWA